MQFASAVIQVGVIVWTLCVTDVQTYIQQDGFSEQADRLVRSLTLPEERLRLVPSVLDHLQFALNTRWPGCRAFAFGSTVNGLATPQSDVDCYVRLPNKLDIHNAVEHAKATLEKFPTFFKDFHPQPTAIVPILTLKHIPTGFSVDLSFNGMDGVKNSELVLYLMNLDERVLHLSMIVKHWAKLHKITGTNRMPSYGVITLVMFYLQKVNILPPVHLMQRNATPYIVGHWNVGFEEIAFGSRNNASLYELLGGFFEYYDSFDFDEDIVSPFVGHPVERRLFDDWHSLNEFDLYRYNIANNITRPLELNRVCIQDVFYHNKNLASSHATSLNTTLMTQIRRAARLYRAQNESVYLCEILSIL